LKDSKLKDNAKRLRNMFQKHVSIMLGGRGAIVLVGFLYLKAVRLRCSTRQPTKETGYHFCCRFIYCFSGPVICVVLGAHKLISKTFTLAVPSGSSTNQQW